MNAVVVAVIVMLILSLLRMNVVLALIIGGIAGGLVGGMSVDLIVEAFMNGVGGGAGIALSYALLGGFAVAISYTGLPKWLVDLVIQAVSKQTDSRGRALSKALIVFVLLMISCFSQNLVPIHIAFIPLLIPPILYILNELQIDRRLIACVLTFGLTAPYMLLPVGFGELFHKLLTTNIIDAGLDMNANVIPKAIVLPVIGMVVGLLIAVFISYRKPREYRNVKVDHESADQSYSRQGIIFALIAIVVTVIVQIWSDSMVFGAVSGILILYITGAVKWSETDSVLTQGMQMMAFIGFVMIAASGFAEIVKETGHVELLVASSVDFIGHNKLLGASLMLLVGLLVTIGIGSSFSTIPIIATIYVPLCLELGFSPLATISLVGTAAALGDAGSPASDSTLGPTAGLNVDGQHNHIWDTCVPTFIHYNIPLVIFGLIAAMIL